LNGARCPDGSAGRPLYPVLHSPSSRNATIFNRDVLAAINISLIAKTMALGYVHPYRGPQFAPRGGGSGGGGGGGGVE
jgi:hypothetical protein